MISSETFNNLKYFSKIGIIFVIVFLLLKYIINLKPYEAILLACIIAVSILIIENIIYINNRASDPLDCDQCKVQKVSDNSNNDNLNNMVPNPLSDNLNSNTMSQSVEKFESDTVGGNLLKIFQDKSKELVNNVAKTLNEISPEMAPEMASEMASEMSPETKTEIMDKIKSNLSANPDMVNKMNQAGGLTPDQVNDLKNNIQTMQDDNYEYRCIKIPKNEMTTTTDSSNINNNNNQVTSNDQSNQIEGFQNLDGYIDENYINESKNFDQKLFSEQSNGPVSLTGTVANSTSSTPSTPSTTSTNSSQGKLVDGTSDPINPVDATFDSNYVSYQKDGMQKLENKESLDQNIWRASIGNQEVVQSYLKDGQKFYNNIMTWSTDAPKTYEALNSELQYGNYNYISPLNKGMTNREYTFINPTNWYPIPPFPPVCVTNRRCVTSPVMISDGKDYMNYAALEDFDAARRFTGDMQINVDYIKNVLNNPDGY